MVYTKNQGAIIRSRVRWYEEGEKNTKYFIGLEKSRAVKKILTEIIKTNGKKITNERDILNETVDFFSKLYSSKEINIDIINDYLNDTNTCTLSENDALMCEGLLTIEECTDAVKKLKNNKAPGSDGLTSEFYKCFWEDVKDLVVDSINEGFLREELSCTQKRKLYLYCIKKVKKVI